MLEIRIILTGSKQISAILTCFFLRYIQTFIAESRKTTHNIHPEDDTMMHHKTHTQKVQFVMNRSTFLYKYVLTRKNL